MERVVLAGIVVLRWAALAWVAVALAVTGDDLQRPWLVLGVVTLALAFTALSTPWFHRATARLRSPVVLSVELGIAAALVLGNGWASSDAAASASQSIASIWPLAAVLSVGAAVGSTLGVMAGLALGVARWGAELAGGTRNFDDERMLSLANTTVLYMVAGAVSGYVMRLLRQAEREISAARAREEVARDLHDGVLQTLAVIQRRARDADLVRLAREQDRNLRRFLFGDGQADQQPEDLAAALRSEAARCEDSFGVRTEVLVPSELPRLDGELVAGVSRAVGEALTNAGKHARASRVTVFVDAEDDGVIFCSVKDDGVGFEPGAASAGVGIQRSIRDRMTEMGGRADVRSSPGEGTEVCLWL